MFKIVDHPEFTHDVPVLVPIDGGHREEKFKCRFRLASEEETAELSVIDAGKPFLRRVIVQIFDVVDEAGEALVWSDELRERLIDLPFVRAGLARAYFAAIAKARAGN